MEVIMANRKHPKTDLYRSERANGLTLREIAAKYGVSYQRVHQACGKQGVGHFRTNRAVVYPNICKWINTNKITTSELVRRMDLVVHAHNIDRIRNILLGRAEPRKHEIDKLIEITGMSYDELFREG
jgi:transcriptional regulator with XRE-family HTH domain